MGLVFLLVRQSLMQKNMRVATSIIPIALKQPELQTYL